MQAGSAVQDELIDFISASRRDDLAKLLRYAGELLPPGGGGDGIAAQGSMLRSTVRHAGKRRYLLSPFFLLSELEFSVKSSVKCII